MEKTNNKPAFDRRLGHIRVAVWENQSNGTTWHNIAITRRWKEGDAWRESPTFSGIGDLAQVAAAVRLAQEWVSTRLNELAQAGQAAESDQQ